MIWYFGDTVVIVVEKESFRGFCVSAYSNKMVVLPDKNSVHNNSDHSAYTGHLESDKKESYFNCRVILIETLSGVYYWGKYNENVKSFPIDIE